MTTVRNQITSADNVICNNIDLLSKQRGLLSQNILSQLRNLVEGVSVRLQSGSSESTFNYDCVGPSIEYVKSSGKLNFIGKFHKLIQKSASHYTLDGDNSERLMLKYYEYLHRIRSLVEKETDLKILRNLEKFPIDIDPALFEYHQKIVEVIDKWKSRKDNNAHSERYYIHKVCPFFCNGRVFYEVTFFRATNLANKFDRVIAFTDIDISNDHAAMLKLQHDSIEVIGYNMPITIIRSWEVSIRPCELDNFAKLFSVKLKTRTSSDEYKFLMKYLTERSESLLDVVTLNDDKYITLRALSTQSGSNTQIFDVLDKARAIIKNSYSGHNVIRYLMLHMNNQIIKSQYQRDTCSSLSGLKIKFGCIPFDSMPFCTSLPGHNPRYWDLLDCIESESRQNELLARKVKNNIEVNGILYTPESELAGFGNVQHLINQYNSKLYYKHQGRKIFIDRGHISISKYENEIVSIIEMLQSKASSGISGYAASVEQWLSENQYRIDDHIKSEALQRLFEKSRIALIYGAAGTGKSTMLDHIARYFNDKEKLFLAHTNPAIDNLQRKIAARNSEFRTIRSHASKSQINKSYDLLIIDECSTVSNTDLLTVLDKTSFKLLVLVGDIYQIESIQFGNWFEIIRHFINKNSVFELTTPYRTNNKELLAFWTKVRQNEDDIAESIAKNGYSTLLNNSLFDSHSDDEIILCLNYDGLYGINNINRFLQSKNNNESFSWRELTYKVGDPVLFSNAELFRPVIYNNLKGWIVDIVQQPGWIRFDVKLDRPLSEFDVDIDGLTWIRESTIQFTVYDFPNVSDDDDDSLNTVIPFQVAYSSSIHKAQGLEYNSVKIVITDANEDDISHSIFYTAITRAREKIKIFWTPETQQKILSRLNHKTNKKDVHLLKTRRGLTPC
ncbi:ATP-dependent RecD-like DNA helicase [Aeromonas enteropelogenes]|uniref:ATP-dependent DNA helicase n=1 Tax=Aeromonas enteropelogenes TaxID=29489 RepID=UPI0038D0373C